MFNETCAFDLLVYTNNDVSIAENVSPAPTTTEFTIETPPACVLMCILFHSYHIQAQVPVEWAESDPKYIQDSNEVRLRSFTTQIHKVDTMVRCCHAKRMMTRVYVGYCYCSPLNTLSGGV